MLPGEWSAEDTLVSGEVSTITSVTLGRGHGGHDPQRKRPVLLKILECDQPLAPSARHVLDDVDIVEMGRGERGHHRDERRGAIRIPDGRMSAEHARLTRTPGGFLLEDLGSKNGLIVNGTVTRGAVLAHDDVFELGHTFFLFREVPVPPEARPDMTCAELPSPTRSLRTFVAALERSHASLARIARTGVAVVLLGETGTGKEVVARALHELSGRPGPFVPVNCGALPEHLIEAELFGHKRGAFSGAISDRPGLIRMSDRGTLFLDEVGELPAESQVAFLRVLQEQEVVPVGDERPIKVDTRLCAATHRDLDELVARGAFRRDLYARLFGLVLELPPLRDRIEDLGILIAALLARMSGGESVRFAPAAVRAFLRHDWPLNIRELEKCLVAAIALAGSDPIELEHLPPSVRRPRAQRPVRDSEPPPLSPEDVAIRDQMIELLTTHEGNVTAVAKALGKGRMQIHRWAKRFGVDLEAFRRG
jgi:sigma-54 dependent transcriptional regulator, acetoin dehydrogenase operon transcriptional activator AcoR